MLLDTKNKNFCGLGVGISTVFKMFGHFLFEGDQDHPRAHGLHVHIICLLTLKTLIYMVCNGDLNEFWNIEHFLCQGDGRTPYGYNIYDDAKLHKKQEYKWLYKGWDVDKFEIY